MQISTPFQLSPNSVLEILTNKNYVLSPDLLNNGIKHLDVGLFRNLSEDCSAIQKTIESQGFCVLSSPDCFEKDFLSSLFYLVGLFLGDPIVQNAKDEKLVEVRDLGHSLEAGGRYHNTNVGGNYHTDAPQYSSPPDTVGLLCINKAKAGGESKLCSAFTIYSRIKSNHPDLLEPLFQPFHFDKKGDFKPGELPTTYAPIFTNEVRTNEGVPQNQQSLSFRYLRNYIQHGHVLQNSPLTSIQIQALDAIDEVLSDDSEFITLLLEPGHMFFFNNRTFAHGRTYFEDFDESDKKRTMMRLWLTKR